MKTITKASIAAAAGAVLLVTGGSTLALWTDTVTGGSGVITSGTLDLLDPQTTGTWTIWQDVQGDGAPDAPAVAFDPTTGTIVPGDVLSFTQTVPVELTGTRIAAQWAADIEVTASTTDPEDVALAAAIAERSRVTFTSTGGDLLLAGDVLTGTGTGAIEVTTDLVFPWGDGDSGTNGGDAGDFNAAQLGVLGFTVDYTLTQVPAVAVP